MRLQEWNLGIYSLLAGMLACNGCLFAEMATTYSVWMLIFSSLRLSRGEIPIYEPVLRNGAVSNVDRLQYR